VKNKIKMAGAAGSFRVIDQKQGPLVFNEIVVVAEPNPFVIYLM
jgi:hypothetical protein